MSVRVHNCKNDSTIFNTKNWVEYTDNIRVALKKQKPKLAQETQELSSVEYICPECDCING